MSVYSVAGKEASTQYWVYYYKGIKDVNGYTNLSGEYEIAVVRNIYGIRLRWMPIEELAIC